MTFELTGYAPGAFGWCVGLHGSWYAENAGFGRDFEIAVATGMAEFLERDGVRGNRAVFARDDSGWLGTASIDLDRAEDGLAKLRWVIVEARARGLGVGRAVLTAVLDHARDAGADGVFLDTFAGLDAARRLYEAAGFELVGEAETDQYGPVVIGQRFEMRFG